MRPSDLWWRVQDWLSLPLTVWCWRRGHDVVSSMRWRDKRGVLHRHVVCGRCRRVVVTNP